ncbi:hypothetical protein H072_2772 [Dactylellina haptotyla CBS 200.50]|uniref:Pentacotripeptide-repeat region of PRORP domain-containing protein n=1 Tax=Dactylellina haptotyla (strain CBS 200.50) TaxID=1284197 RepID=S8BUT8_DACHA|nr:hypothetical protein H072_2772 [Dactylellina haptotyla CBS 200.50]
MQRLAYVCASCRRSGAARIIESPGRRSLHAATDFHAPKIATGPRAAASRPKPHKAEPKASSPGATPTKSKKPDNHLIFRASGGNEPKATGAQQPLDQHGLKKVSKPRGWAKPSGFYAESYDSPRHDLAELSKKLARDKGLIAEVYREFEGFLIKHKVVDRMSLKVMLLQGKFLRNLVKTMIKYRHKIEDLPSLSAVLRTFLENGVHDEKLWAEVMFEYIRTEYYDDALELWHDRLECQKDHPFAFVNSNNAESSGPPDFLKEVAIATPLTVATGTFASSSYESHCYPTVAALTAFLWTRKMLMMPTELSDLLRFIAPNGEDIATLLPPTLGIGSILREYNVSPEVIESTLADLQDFRPYSDENNKEYTFMFDKVFLAASNQDLAAVRRIYHDSKARIPENLRGRSYYTSFINAFLRCGSRGDGDILWRDMLNAGIMPTVKAWANWLDGCSKARDFNLFQQGWERMLAQNFEPDTICWTIRMQMLFMIGDPEAAKSCLQHMVNKGVTITVGTVNVAVSKLNTVKMYRDAFDLIKWAVSCGIEIDVVTYNLILDSRAKLGDFPGILETLKSMETRGILPDIITYGIVLRGMYNNTDHEPDISVLQAVLGDIKAKGIQPNLQFYNTIIHAMLSRWNDIKGALYVLSLMPNDAWRGSSVTSSIFIHYYGRTGNIAAIEAVWENMRSNTLAPDDVVYNATVVAYALAGLKDKMMEYLDTMARLRKKIQLVTYNRVLACVMLQEDYESAREVLGLMKLRGVDITTYKESREVLNRLQEVAIDAKRAAYTQRPQPVRAGL